MLRVLYSPLFSARIAGRGESCTSIFFPPFPGPRFKALWWRKSRWQMQRDSKLLTHSSSVMLWSAKEFRPNLKHESFVRGKMQFTRPVECKRYILKECIFSNLGIWDKKKNLKTVNVFDLCNVYVFGFTVVISMQLQSLQLALLLTFQTDYKYLTVLASWFT